uniref:Cytoskeleton-associated protein 5 n=1 Tax=Heterorhabditis bacteriophora TaxID=37862 RepID=A0A1I7WRL4_HETBA
MVKDLSDWPNGSGLKNSLNKVISKIVGTPKRSPDRFQGDNFMLKKVGKNYLNLTLKQVQRITFHINSINFNIIITQESISKIFNTTDALFCTAVAANYVREMCNLSMSCSREVEVALRYLQQVLSSKNPQLILASISAVLDAVSVHCNSKNKKIQAALVKLLQCADKTCLQPSEDISCVEMRKIVDELSKIVSIYPSSKSSTASSSNSFNNGSEGSAYCESTSPTLVSSSKTTGTTPLSSASQRSMKEPLILAEQEEHNLDELLKQLNLRKEERAEKHGQKMCEEEIQTMPDGTEVRRKKTRTVNVQQSSKHTLKWFFILMFSVAHEVNRPSDNRYTPKILGSDITISLSLFGSYALLICHAGLYRCGGWEVR